MDRQSSRTGAFAGISLSLVVGALALFVAPTAFAAEGDSAGQRVQEALVEMHSWVGLGSRGDGWRRYLKSAKLQLQLQLGSQADVAAVEEVLARFSSGKPGLETPPFVKVRKALEAWVAELKQTQPEDLPALVAEFKDKYPPVATEEVTQAKAKLAAAAKQLETYLGTGKRAAIWKKFLEWDLLKAELARQGDPDLKSLRKVYRQFVENYPGLELPKFAAVGDSLLAYMEVASLADAEDAKQQYADQLEALAKSLSAYANEATADEHWQIGYRLGNLPLSRQAPALIRSVRKQFSRPNLFAEATAGLVSAGLKRKVERQVRVNEYILGSDITGTGQLVGQVDARLVPNPNEAQIETVFSGTIQTNTVGRQSPVTFYSSGITSFTALKKIIFRHTGISVNPTRASAVTNNNVHDVSAGAIATRVAWRRIAENRSASNRIASERSAARIRSTYDREAGPMLAKANERFLEKFRNPMLRLREFPERLQFSTTTDALYVVGLQAGRSAIGAPDSPPDLKARYDLSLRVHESMPNNLALALLAGQTLDDEGVKKRVIAMRGSLPDSLKDDEDQDPWTITFAREQPVTVLFADGGFHVTIRGQKYTSGDRSFRSMNVSANYKMEPAEKGIRLKRQGEVRIVPPDFDEKERQLTVAEISLRDILARKFSKIFTEEVVSEGLELPGQWKQAGKLYPQEVISDKGWLAIGWNRGGEQTIKQAAAK